MPTTELIESRSAKFDGEGRAAVIVEPQRSYETWHIVQTHIHTSSPTQTQFTIYRDAEEPGNIFEGTALGNSDESDSELDLRAGQRLIYVWREGTSGEIATVTLRGTRTT